MLFFRTTYNRRSARAEKVKAICGPNNTWWVVQKLSRGSSYRQLLQGIHYLTTPRAAVIFQETKLLGWIHWQNFFLDNLCCCISAHEKWG